MIDGDDYTYDERYSPPGSKPELKLAFALAIVALVLLVLEALMRQ